MDKPNEPTHRPAEPIHGPHHRSPDPHRRRVRSLLEAAHYSPDPATTCVDLATMGVDPLGRHRQWLWRLSGSGSAWSSSSASDPGVVPPHPRAAGERGRVELPELMMMHMATIVEVVVPNPLPGKEQELLLHGFACPRPVRARMASCDRVWRHANERRI
jgi:hypothetical protein